MCRPGTTKVTTAAEFAVLVTAPVLEAEEAGADPVAVAVAAPAALLTGALPSAADADAAVAVAAEPEAAEADVANATLEATEDSPFAMTAGGAGGAVATLAAAVPEAAPEAIGL